MTILILGIFVTFMVFEVHGIILREGYALDGIRNLLTASFFGVVGLVAAGMFREEVSVDEARRRATQFAKNTETLQMAEMALNASHTAIAIADRRRRIVLVNPVFVRLCGRRNIDNNGALLGCMLENVLRLSSQDYIVLASCFRETCSAEAEFQIEGRVIHVQISPNSAVWSSDDRNRFVVVIKDVTEERALERVIESVQEQASRTRAIMDAIAALTQRLPSPAPPPPDGHRNLAMRPAISDETNESVYFRQMDDAGEMGPMGNENYR
jgi:PAS domain S-box-containing protein